MDKRGAKKQIFIVGMALCKISNAYGPLAACCGRVNRKILEKREVM
jgi:hypothetical protein